MKKTYWKVKVTSGKMAGEWCKGSFDRRPKKFESKKEAFAYAWDMRNHFSDNGYGVFRFGPKPQDKPEISDEQKRALTRHLAIKALQREVNRAHEERERLVKQILDGLNERDALRKRIAQLQETQLQDLPLTIVWSMPEKRRR